MTNVLKTSPSIDWVTVKNFLQKLNNTEKLSAENVSFGKKENLVERLVSPSVGIRF